MAQENAFLKALAFLEGKFDRVEVPLVDEWDGWKHFIAYRDSQVYTFTFKAMLSIATIALKNMPTALNHFLLFYSRRFDVFFVVHSFEVKRCVRRNYNGNFHIYLEEWCDNDEI